jgi:hypothetical protein
VNQPESTTASTRTLGNPCNRIRILPDLDAGSGPPEADEAAERREAGGAGRRSEERVGGGRGWHHRQSSCHGGEPAVSPPE